LSSHRIALASTRPWPSLGIYMHHYLRNIFDDIHPHELQINSGEFCPFVAYGMQMHGTICTELGFRWLTQLHVL
jgi:hypothetical protein